MSGIMDGKVCLVAGATSGIGRVTARALAKMGATVVAVGRNREKGEATVADIKRRSASDCPGYRLIPAVEYNLSSHG